MKCVQGLQYIIHTIYQEVLNPALNIFSSIKYFYLLLFVSSTNLLLLFSFFCKISVARQSFIFKVPGTQTNKYNLKIFQNMVLYISRNHADFLLLWTQKVIVSCQSSSSTYKVPWQSCQLWLWVCVYSPEWKGHTVKAPNATASWKSFTNRNRTYEAKSSLFCSTGRLPQGLLCSVSAPPLTYSPSACVWDKVFCICYK